ncbi:nitrous oxide reductase family maturation protein NosD [Desulfomonile tiedjei]|uniref:Parallel beta-helix repeat (Two copies) n=1 Tax=Desulfomonile tiedjei (strain ATCC 49306 / DSM 6799 / DCB-1) TaxID=706587 RepID=I4C1E5_DESTA|nr:nitrous oxide reductase family maturation protein NosD [Desulfomonile tiedjei]AFM23386.1 parallel beta-helix repeat (two copies) [Desulfomonile tiedjei DSM 6799]
MRGGYNYSGLMRGFVIAAVTAFVAIVVSPLWAAVITVGRPADGESFDSIQEALDKASPGDEIRVYPGIYHGNIQIRTNGIVMEGIDRPVIQGEKTGNAVTLEADGVTFKGFLIRGGGRDLLKDDAGIKFVKAKECLVTENRLEDNLYGMYLSQAEKCVITHNVIRGRTYDFQEDRGNGIHTWDSPFNRIEHNDIADARDGFYISFSHFCTIDHNKVHRTRYGLHYMYSNNNSFSYNTLIDNVAGAAVMYAKGFKFSGNVFAHNRGFRAYGVLWQDVRHSDCFDNLVFDNTIGFYFDQAGMSKVHNNLVISNDVASVILENSEDNVIFENNFVNNLSLLRLRGATQAGRNNVFYKDGKGNYWSDYRGYDLDGDGVGDRSYKLEGIFDALEADIPELRLFLFSPLTAALELAERAFPIIEVTVTAEDKFPLMKPVKIGGPPPEAIAKSRVGSAEAFERVFVGLFSSVLLGVCLLMAKKGRAVG